MIHMSSFYENKFLSRFLSTLLYSSNTKLWKLFKVEIFQDFTFS